MGILPARRCNNRLILTNVTAILMGILVIMNVYVIKHSKLKLVNRHFLEQA
jgi:hypothetical protein